MRVLHVSDFFPPVRGGVEGHVDDLTSAQAQRGYEVHVATLTRDPEPSDPRVRTHVVGAAASRILPHADADRPFHPPLPDPSARRELRNVIDRVRPDVVHAHTWLGISVPPRSGVPLVLTAHDYALVCQLRTLFRTDGVRCAGPSAACVRCGSRIYGWARSTLMATGTAAGRRLWHPEVVITLSRHVAQTLGRHLRAPIEVCGGLLPATSPRDVALPTSMPAAPFALFAGDPGQHKGFDVLLAAWEDPRLATVPLVVASTKEIHRTLRERIVVVRLDRAQMPSAWRRAAIAVVPSIWDEPFGMVAMEALAAGTPVVASRVGALGEVVRDGIDGALVEPGDPGALATAVHGLLADDARRSRLAAAAIEGAARFGSDAVLDRIEAVYERVLAARAATS